MTAKNAKGRQNEDLDPETAKMKQRKIERERQVVVGGSVQLDVQWMRRHLAARQVDAIMSGLAECLAAANRPTNRPTPSWRWSWGRRSSSTSRSS